ncbi:MAG: hypothetical protein ACLFRX_11210, partial [Gemmatimonadota bacterium]
PASPVAYAAATRVAGALFSGILGLVESGRGFDQLSLPRFASGSTPVSFSLPNPAGRHSHR